MQWMEEHMTITEQDKRQVADTIARWAAKLQQAEQVGDELAERQYAGWLFAAQIVLGGIGLNDMAELARKGRRLNMTKSYESQLADGQAHIDSMMPTVDEQADAREREIDRILYDDDAALEDVLEESGMHRDFAKAIVWLRHRASQLRVTNDVYIKWSDMLVAVENRAEFTVAAWVDEQLRKAVTY
jgi:hypothetical protein